MTMNVIQEGYSYGFFWVMTSFQIMASFWLVTRMRVYSTMTECRLFGKGSGEIPSFAIDLL